MIPRQCRGFAAAALALLLAACGGGVVPISREVPVAHEAPPLRRPVPSQPLAPAPALSTPGAATAVLAGAIAGPSLEALPITQDGAARALAAFRTSCASLVRRADPTGLTQGADWQPACAAAAGADGDPRGFFLRWFEAVQIGDGKAFATGYYEPEILGAREHRAGYDVPIYGRPSDLIDVDLGQFSDALKGKKIRGRVNGRNFVPYYERAEIDAGAIRANAPVIAWAADPVSLFFLQIQGSGLLRLPDGGTMRIGYDTQNGRDYVAVGAVMKQRGLLEPGHTTMQDITAWLRAHPAEGAQVMDQNKSFVFFRVLSGPPLGALGVAVTGGVTVAADAHFVPLGAPVFLSMDRADATGLWVAQDTGGAIRGTNRFDTFWGAGEQAEAIAGGMAAHGTAFLLLPIGTLQRLAQKQGQGSYGGTTPYP